MLSLLDQVQSGIVNPRSFMVIETTRRLFNLELSKYRDLERVHTGGVNSIDIEAVENRYMLSASADGGISIHDLMNVTGQPHYTCKIVCKIKRKSRYAHSFSVDTVQWYPFDTGIFTSSGMDNKLKVWDANTLKPADTFTLQGKVYGHNMSTVATHHTLIAAALSCPNVVLIDLKSGSKCHELRGHKGMVVSVRWSPSQEFLLATGGADNRIFLWDIRSSKGYLRSFDQHNGEAVGSRRGMITAHSGVVNSLCFTSDGLYLISYGTDCRMRLWDVALSLNTLVNYGKIPNDNPKKMQIDVSYNSCLPLIFVPTETSVLVVDMFSGATMANLLGHFNTANCCAFRPHYHELYSGGNDRNLLLWTPDSEQESLFAEYEREKAAKSSALGPSRKLVTVDAWSSDDD